MVSAMLAFSRPVEMRVDGQRLDTDVPPVTATADRVYVPLRALANALGADTSHDSATGQIVVTRGNQSLRLKVGETHATFNGMPVTLHTAPFRVRGRVMIGMKSFARVFGLHATYDRTTARIDVSTNGVVDSTGTEPTE
jgi:hypothetical protein